MASGRVAVVLILTLTCSIIEAKVFTRCQLTRELLKNNFPRTFVSNWVCLVEQVSDRNTSALVTKTSRKKFYGLFQIGSEYCKEGRKGGKCDISCEALLDEDIKDDGVCALKVFEQDGFKYWSRWETRCKGHTLPDIEKCPDWVHPPSNRASPARDKRTIRAKRVSEVRSNVTSDGLLTVLISIMGLPPPRAQYILPRSQRLSTDTKHFSTNCYVVLAVLSRGSLVAQKDTPCQSTLEISMEGFLRGPYEVCATLSKRKIDEMRQICVVPQFLEPIGSLEMKSGIKGLNTALVGVALGLMVIVIGLVWFVRKMLKKPAQFEPHHRCFRQETVHDETPRANYVMLTATSKL